MDASYAACMACKVTDGMISPLNFIDDRYADIENNNSTTNATTNAAMVIESTAAPYSTLIMGT